MSTDKTHIADLEELGHNTTNSFDGGICITKCPLTKDYTPNCSCSYRWQGKFSAMDHGNIYNKDYEDIVAAMDPESGREDAKMAPKEVKAAWKAIREHIRNLREKGQKQTSLSGISVGRLSKKKKWLPRAYGKFLYGKVLNLPRKGITGDWYPSGPTSPDYQNTDNWSDLHGPGTEFTTGIPIGANFTKSTWPYWNNHHHLIPAKTLEQAITKKASDKIKPLSLQNWVAFSPYNLHNKKNMMVLPMDKTVAFLLGLPRHLRFGEPLENADGKIIVGDYCNHLIYNEYVTQELDRILERAAKLYVHEKITKTRKSIGNRLNKLSKTLFSELVQMGGMSNVAVSADHLLKLKRKRKT